MFAENHSCNKLRNPCQMLSQGGGKGERESNTREGGRVHNHKINLKNMQQVNAQKHNHDLTLGM